MFLLKTFSSLLFLIVFVSTFLFLSKEVFAATVTIDNVPSLLDQDQEFSVSVNVSGALANTNNYLRGAFYSDTSKTSYFGYTFNHFGNWYNGTPSPIDPHSFLQIGIDANGNWSGDLKAKSDIKSNYFKGNGVYSFKIGRYTANGSSVTDWSDSYTLTINMPTPTPSPSQDPTSTPTPSKNPTSSPTAKQSLTTKPSLNPSNKQTLTPLLTSPILSKDKLIAQNSLSSEVLGNSTASGTISSTLTKNPSPTITKKILAASQNILSKLLIGLGVILIVSCGILSFRSYRMNRKNKFDI